MADIARKQKPAPDDVIVMRGESISLSSSEGRQFTTDVCRCAEGLQSDDDLRRQYDISDTEWGNITEHKGLIKALRAERDRRIRNGQAAREHAAKIHVRAPAILGEIMEDKGASPRHRIESAKELRACATSGDGADAASAGAVFSITINLGEDHIEHYEKPIKLVEPTSPINQPIKEIE